jgi:hypothetical protein
VTYGPRYGSASISVELAEPMLPVIGRALSSLRAGANIDALITAVLSVFLTR